MNTEIIFIEIKNNNELKNNNESSFQELPSTQKPIIKGVLNKQKIQVELPEGVAATLASGQKVFEVFEISEAEEFHVEHTTYAAFLENQAYFRKIEIPTTIKLSNIAVEKNLAKETPQKTKEELNITSSKSKKIPGVLSLIKIFFGIATIPVSFFAYEISQKNFVSADNISTKQVSTESSASNLQPSSTILKNKTKEVEKKHVENNADKEIMKKEKNKEILSSKDKTSSNPQVTEISKKEKITRLDTKCAEAAQEIVTLNRIFLSQEKASQKNLQTAFQILPGSSKCKRDENYELAVLALSTHVNTYIKNNLNMFLEKTYNGNASAISFSIKNKMKLDSNNKELSEKVETILKKKRRSLEIMAQADPSAAKAEEAKILEYGMGLN